MYKKYRKKQGTRIAKIRRSIRSKISGTAERPRLSVFRSNAHIYAQVIDDVQGVTLASASCLAAKLSGSATEKATQVGKLVAEAAKAAGVEAVVFDRGGNPYHGRVKALAEGAREGGLQF
jgi:large subunit ribosomal protein L18